VYEGALQNLVDELGRLPGIGPKSAQRIAFHLLQVDDADARRLAATIVRVRDTVTTCTTCFNVSEQPTCRVCRDDRRDPAVLCVVEEARDVVAIERTRSSPAATTSSGARSRRSTASVPTSCACVSS
jgi:recombination protein RecR